MRPNFVFSEVVTGLRRNVTMTIAMILTTAISLGLLGGGLLIVRLIDRMQDLYYDQVEVVVFLNNDISANDNTCSQNLCQGLEQSLKSTSGVQSVDFESRDQAYQRFQKIFSSQPELVQLARPESLPASLRIKLDNPQRFPAIQQQFAGRPGVKTITNQGDYLKRLFGILNGVRNATFAVALIQAMAALLLISNTIQLSAFTRRTETGIMRLVGATRWRTQLPFLLEAVAAGLIGAVLAIGGLVVSKVTFIDSVLAAPMQAGIIPQITAGDIAYISPILLLVATAISAVTGYVTLRMYVRH